MTSLEGEKIPHSLAAIRLFCMAIEDIFGDDAKFASHVTAAGLHQRVILSDLFKTPETHDLFRITDGDVDECYKNEETGRILWIYNLPDGNDFFDDVYPPFKNNPCRNFIIELDFDAKETHAPHTEQLVRQKVGGTFVPKRLATRNITVDSQFPCVATLYESVAGVRNLTSLWDKKVLGTEKRQVLEDLLEMKKTLNFVSPPEPDFEVYSDPQAALRFDRKNPKAPVLHPSYDFSRWNITVAPVEAEKDPAILHDAKPVLALLNRHIPYDVRAEASVSPGGAAITLSLPNCGHSVTFSARDMRLLKEKMFLHHQLTNIHDVFVQGSGKNCRVVAVLGWGSAEYCPAGYGMGQLDAMLGKEIKDTAWYLTLRREGFKRRTTKNTNIDPSQIKLADMMHIMCSYHDYEKMTHEELKAKRVHDAWMEKRQYVWKGARVGWQTGTWKEFKNLVRDYWEYHSRKRKY